MKSFFRIFCISVLLLAPLSAAHAEQYLAVGAGWFNFNRNGDNSVNFNGEWRGNTFFYGLLPVVGASINTDGGTYGYAGLNYDLELTPHWVVTPGVNIGGWAHGSSIDLGGVVEFREMIELDYKFDNSYRLGAQINHTSNAHLYSDNPGVNSIMAMFSIPLGK